MRLLAVVNMKPQLIEKKVYICNYFYTVNMDSFTFCLFIIVFKCNHIFYDLKPYREKAVWRMDGYFYNGISYFNNKSNNNAT